MIVNSPIMPVRAPQCMYDTYDAYKQENVSYGSSHDITFSNDVFI